MMSNRVPADWDDWMRRCFALAEEARQEGDAPVGAVIVQDGVLIAEACEQVKAKQDIAAHAELLAIQEACKALGTTRLTNCQLITNVELCGMCSFAIRETGIRHVVIGRPVEDIGGVTSRYPILTDANIPGWGPPPEVIWRSVSELS